MTVTLTGTTLTLEQLVGVARGGEQVELTADAIARMQASRDLVEETLAKGEPVYGFSTGVGMRKLFAIEDDQAGFNRMLIRGHLVAQGRHAPPDVVRATMLKLANMLAQGVSGVRPELAQLVVDTLNAGAVPRVRILGSVGQGDLGPMADLAEGLLGDFELAAGEALVLMDNNAFSTGLAALAVADCATLLDALDVAGALDLEAFAANLSVVDPALGAARPYPGLVASIARIRELLDGSWLWDEAPRNLQDPLTFRTVPQVHGAARDALSYATGVLAVELNAHQGNPVVDAAAGRVLPAGNFDVVPLSAALDFLRIALAPAITSAAERALKLLQASHTRLPEGLGARPQLAEPGLSELGAAVQGIAAEARLLGQPVSFELASTTQHEGIEDRTTMAPLSARRLAEMTELGARVVAIELDQRRSGDRPPRPTAAWRRHGPRLRPRARDRAVHRSGHADRRRSRASRRACAIRHASLAEQRALDRGGGRAENRNQLAPPSLGEPERRAADADDADERGGRRADRDRDRRKPVLELVRELGPALPPHPLELGREGASTDERLLGEARERAGPKPGRQFGPGEFGEHELSGRRGVERHVGSDPVRHADVTLRIELQQDLHPGRPAWGRQERRLARQVAESFELGAGHLDEASVRIGGTREPDQLEAEQPRRRLASRRPGRSRPGCEESERPSTAADRSLGRARRRTSRRVARRSPAAGGSLG